MTPAEKTLHDLAAALAPEVAKLISHTEKRWLTRQEAAERLAVTPQHVDALVRKRHLKAIDIGGGEERRAVRISVESVREFERRREM